MRLRDLGRGASSTGSTEPAAAPSTGQRESGTPTDYKWAVIEPAYAPQEAVLLVIDPACLAEARAENPGMVTFMLAEVELLAPFKDNHEFMRGLHRIKKHLGGWVREVRPPRGDAQPGQAAGSPSIR